MFPPSPSKSNSSDPDEDPPLISMSHKIPHLVLLPFPETMLNIPLLQEVMSVVPARRDKFPPDTAVPDTTITIMAHYFPPNLGPVSKSTGKYEPIDTDPV